MTENDSDTALETALAQVSDHRRAFLRGLLAGATTAALGPFIVSEAAAQPPLPGKGLFFKGGEDFYPFVFPYKGGSYAGKGGGYSGKGGGGYSSKGGGRYSGKGSSGGGAGPGGGKGPR